MKTIWKFVVPTQKQFKWKLPKGAQHLRTEIQGDESTGVGKAQSWWLVDPKAEREERAFEVFGTGMDIPDGGTYIGMWQAPPFVWWLFEVVPEKILPSS